MREARRDSKARGDFDCSRKSLVFRNVLKHHRVICWSTPAFLERSNCQKTILRLDSLPSSRPTSFELTSSPPTITIYFLFLSLPSSVRSNEQTPSHCQRSHLLQPRSSSRHRPRELSQRSFLLRRQISLQANSEVFDGMFAVPPPKEQQHTVKGLPVVKVGEEGAGLELLLRFITPNQKRLDFLTMPFEMTSE